MLSKLLHKSTDEFTPIVDATFVQADYFPIDMSRSNKNMTIELLANPQLHHQYLQNLLQLHNAQVAYGGYLEQRSLYDRSDYFQAADIKDKRNIHLGESLVPIQHKSNEST